MRLSQTKSPRSPRSFQQADQSPNNPRARSLPVPVPASSAAAKCLVNTNAAGIDTIHSDMHMVCVPADRDAISSPAVSAPTPPIFRRSPCG